MGVAKEPEPERPGRLAVPPPNEKDYKTPTADALPTGFELPAGEEGKYSALIDLNNALEEKFGTLPWQALDKAKQMATKAILRKARIEAQTKTLREKAEAMEAKKGGAGAGGKDAKEAETPQVEADPEPATVDIPQDAGDAVQQEFDAAKETAAQEAAEQAAADAEAEARGDE